MPIDVDKLILAVAERFTHYEMRAHLALLRAYYARRRRQQGIDAKQKLPPWEIDMVLEWATLLRV